MVVLLQHGYDLREGRIRDRSTSQCRSKHSFSRGGVGQSVTTLLEKFVLAFGHAYLYEYRFGRSRSVFVDHTCTEVSYRYKRTTYNYVVHTVKLTFTRRRIPVYKIRILFAKSRPASLATSQAILLFLRC